MGQRQSATPAPEAGFLPSPARARHDGEERTRLLGRTVDANSVSMSGGKHSAAAEGKLLACGSDSGSLASVPPLSGRSAAQGAAAASQHTEGEHHKEAQTLVQFSAPIYYVEEDEGSITIDIIRFGSTRGVAKVGYRTLDLSAKAGERYAEASGQVVFQDGEDIQSIEVKLLPYNIWSAVLEFQVCLERPEDCILGQYLHVARVKLIDDTHFPSNKYLPQLRALEIDDISGPGLLWEYVKLMFSLPGNPWRTAMTLVMDQLDNLYRFFKLWLSVYMVNVIFHRGSEGHAQEHRDAGAAAVPLLSSADMTMQIYMLGLGYVCPMLLLHVWTTAKTRMDLQGRCAVFLQAGIFRTYLNYSEESRDQILPSDMQKAVMCKAVELASGYVDVLRVAEATGKIAVLLYFTQSENPVALSFTVLLLAVMFAWGYLRESCCHDGADEQEDLSRALDAFIANICDRYQLIANYHQRPRMNDIFAQQRALLREADVRVAVFDMHTRYFFRWLGPVFVGLYIAFSGPSVITGSLGLGNFLATMGILKDLPADVVDLYSSLLSVARTIDPLREFTRYLNLPTDVRGWKQVNRKRRTLTKRASFGIDAKDECRWDRISISVTDLSFCWPSENRGIFSDAHVSVPQGSMVAVAGAPGTGKQTLMRLLAQELFPSSGQILVPTHLRINHVSPDTQLLRLSAWQNLIFGLSTVGRGDAERIEAILERLRMRRTLELVRGDLVRVKENPGRTSTFQVSAAEMADPNWEGMNSSELAKLHLARALIRNPEVLVVQRPFHHFNEDEGRKMLAVIREHVDNRGICMPEATRDVRRPRTCFFTADNSEQMRAADVVWRIDELGIHPETHHL